MRNVCFYIPPFTMFCGSYASSYRCANQLSSNSLPNSLTKLGGSNSVADECSDDKQPHGVADGVADLQQPHGVADGVADLQQPNNQSHR